MKTTWIDSSLCGCLAVYTAILCLSVLGNCQSKRPGAVPYIPTKLEWSALFLQVTDGQNVMTHESPLRVDFIPDADGSTILCLIQYTSDLEAAVLKIRREAIEYSFEKYRASKGWKWLRLRFQEEPLTQRWPGS